MKRKAVISLILGIIASGVALYFAFKNVPFSELTDYMASINYWWIIPSTAVVILSFAVRAVRWRIILASTKQVSYMSAFHPLMIGFMLNCVLPGRIGEVARPVVLQKNDQVPFTAGLATVASERLFDLAMLILLFAAVTATVHIDPDIDMTFGKYHLNRATLEAIARGMLQLSLVLLAGMLFISFDRTRRLVHRLIHGIPRLIFFAGDALKTKIRDKLCRPLVNITDHAAAGFSLVKHPKSLAACALLSMVIWILSALSYYVISFGAPGVDLSYMEMAAVMVIICFFIALPSVPGFWGLWEAGGVFAMTLFGVSAKDAAGYTLASHAIQMFPIILIGFYSAAVTGINIWKVSYEWNT